MLSYAAPSCAILRQTALNLAETGYVDGTLLNGVALLIALANSIAIGAVWYLSRAGKVRSFEGRVYGQLENAASRIERMEAAWLEEKTHLTALADEMVTTAERTAKERRKLYAQHQRDANAPPGNGSLVQPATPDMASLPREEQLRLVRQSLGRS